MDTERTYRRNLTASTFFLCYSLLPILFRVLLGSRSDYPWSHLIMSTGIQLVGSALLILPLLTSKKLWLTIPGSLLLAISLYLFTPYFSVVLRMSESHTYIAHSIVQKLPRISLFLLTLLSAFVLIRPSKNKGVIARFICFVPSVFQLISLIISANTIFFERMSTMFNKTRLFFFTEESVFAILAQSMLLIAVFSISQWLVSPYKGEKYQKRVKPSRSTSHSSAPVKVGTVQLMEHILLLIFTFGIWQYIWIYRTTKFLNEVKSAEYREPTTALLLCIFVPFYSIYWMYQSALRTDIICQNHKIHSDIAKACLLCAFIVPLAAPILIQEKINTYVNR